MQNKGFSLLSPVIQAAILMTLSGLMFGIMNAVIRKVGGELNLFELVFFRNLFAALFFLPWVWSHLEDLKSADRIGLQVLRSTTGLIAMYLFFYSITIMSVADTVALTFTAPLFVLIGAVLFLGERVKMRRWMATTVGFIGMLLIIQPGTDSFNPLSFYPLLSSLFMAVSFLLIKTISRTNDPNIMVFIMTVITTLISFVPMLFVWQMPTMMQWVWLVSLGALGAAAHIFFTHALKLAETSIVIPFDYLRLPFSALFAYLWFFEVPTRHMWLGAGLIVAAAIYIAHRESQLSKTKKS